MNRLIKNKKLFFCYALLLVSVLFFIAITVRRPQKNITSFVYNSGFESKEENITFPIEQKIYVDIDNLYTINLNMGDSTINDYKYSIEILDENNKQIFYDDFDSYDNQSHSLSFDIIKKSKGKIYTLKINCEDCKNVKMLVSRPLNSKNILNSEKNKTLQMSLLGYKFNTFYYWYSLFGIVLSLTLLPLARRK